MRVAMSSTLVTCARLLRALRAARASSACTSGTSRSNVIDNRLVAPDLTLRRRYSSSQNGGSGDPKASFTRRVTETHHPAFPSAPTWSTRDLLHPKIGTTRDDKNSNNAIDEEVTLHELADVARRANLPTPIGDAAVDTARGVNEILRFVRALDNVQNVNHLEPLWTTVSDEDLELTLRPDECENENDENTNGWLAVPREDLLAVAPKRTRERAPHFVTATGMVNGTTKEFDQG